MRTTVTIICWLLAILIEILAGPIDHLYKQTSETQDGALYASFLGIRYDIARKGLTGFRKTNDTPVPIEKETNLNRVVDCLQMVPKFNHTVGSEDCLFLNVYTPVPFENKSMPVLIWIHGTAFPIGSSQTSSYKPTRFMDFNMVVVTFSYRLDVIGFASFEKSELIGNYGLQDQRMAIDWVTRYIHHFGGDPDRITLGGHGMGAAHALFHMRRGKFPGNKVIKRCIAISGTRYAPWAHSYHNWTAKRSYQLIQMLGCRKQGALCIMNSNYNTLVEQSQKLMVKEYQYLWDSVTWPFRPVLDDEYILNYPWLDRQVNNNFDLLLGLNLHEGHLIYSILYERGWTKEQKDILFDTFFKVYHQLKLRFVPYLSAMIREMYDDLMFADDRLLPLMTDGFFFYPAMMEVENHTGPLQAYMFNFHSNLGVFGCSADRVSSGVVHGDDLPYLFEIPGCDIDDKNRRIARKLVSTVARFVENGDAQLRTYEEDSELFKITSAIRNPDEFSNIDSGLQRRLRFWSNLELYKIT